MVTPSAVASGVMPTDLILGVNDLQNSGMITDLAGTIEIGMQRDFFDTSPHSFTNTGTITAAEVDIESAVTSIANTGVIVADRIVLAGDTTLSELTGLHGQVVVSGTLDLQGGTLDAGAFGAGMTVTGSVSNGVLTATGGTLTLDGARLTNVGLVPGGTVVETGNISVFDPPAGFGVTLDNMVTNLQVGAAPVSVLLDISGPTLAMAGTLIAYAGTNIFDYYGSLRIQPVWPGNASVNIGTLAVQAGTLYILGDATIDGSLTLSDGTIFVQDANDGSGALHGAGTITLGAGASVAIGAMDAAATPTFAFTGGGAQLVLPGLGAGVTLDGFQAGDQLDLQGLSAEGVGAASAQVIGGQLVITAASGQTASMALLNAPADATFVVLNDGDGGSLIALQPLSTLTANSNFDLGSSALIATQYILDGGTVTQGDLSISGSYVVHLLNGAAWQTGTISTPWIDNQLVIDGGGTGGTLNAAALSITSYDTGNTLSAVGDATVVVGSMDFGSMTLSVDPVSAMLVGTGTATAGAVTVAADGTLSIVDPGFAGSDGGVTINGALIDRGEIDLSNDITVSGTMVIDAGGTLNFTAGSVAAELIDNGTIMLQPGTRSVSSLELNSTLDVLALTTLEVAGALTIAATGSLDVAAAGALTAGTLAGDGTVLLSGYAQFDAIADTPTIDFTGGTSLLVITGVAPTSLTLAGLQAGDQIDLRALSSLGTATASAQVVDGTLDITSASGETASFALVDAPTDATYLVLGDQFGGTLIADAPLPPLTSTTDFFGTPGTGYGSYGLDGGTVTQGDLTVEGTYAVYLSNGAVWQTGDIAVGTPSFFDSNNNLSGGGSLLIAGAAAGGTLSAGAISLGGEYDEGATTAGNLQVIDGASVFASGMSDMFSGISLDAASSIVLGTATATAGALTVAAGATFDGTDGSLTGNLIDNGDFYSSGYEVIGMIPGSFAISGNVILTSILSGGGYGGIGIGGSLTVLDGGTADGSGAQWHGLAVTGAILLGQDGASTLDAAGPSAGTLEANYYGIITAGGLSLAGGSVVTLDSTSSVMLGTGTATGGAITVASDATLTATTGTIKADVIDAGTLTIGTSLAVTGSFELDSTLTLGPAATLSVGGAFSLGSGGTLDVAGGVLVAGTLNGPAIVTLDGTATIDAVSGSPTVDFGADPATLVLHGAGQLGVSVNDMQLLVSTIDLASLSSAPTAGHAAGHIASYVGGVLDVIGASGQTATLAVTGNFDSSVIFDVTADGHGGTMLVAEAGAVACYAAGTRILAERGEVPVEALRPGDRVRTHSGRLAPVAWVGRTRVDLTRHPHPETAAPVRVQTNAIAPGVPCRDLLLSRDHALFLDGALVPVWQLANGATIARQDGLASVTYFHVELDRHDILLAEGVAAESYLDTGNRSQFANAAGLTTLHPDFATPPDQHALRIWAQHGAAPLLLGGDSVTKLREQLTERAGALGWRRTKDPLPSVVVDGRVLPTISAGGGLWRARLPRGTTSAWLRSRSFIPAEHVRDSGDTRRTRLGSLEIRLAGKVLPQETRGTGWHAPDDAKTVWRWTNGNGSLTFPAITQSSMLEIQIAWTDDYWTAEDHRKSKAS